MAPIFIKGYTDSNFSVYGSGSSRTITLTGENVQQGDLIVVCAWSYVTILGGGEDHTGVTVSQTGFYGSVASGGPSHPGAAGVIRDSWPPLPGGAGDFTEVWGHVGSCIWSDLGSDEVSVAFIDAPPGLTREPPYVQLFIFRDANSGSVVAPTPQTVSGPVPGNQVIFTDGTVSEDAAYMQFLVYFGVRELTSSGNYTAQPPWVEVDVVDQGTLAAAESFPNSDNAVIDATVGVFATNAILQTSVVNAPGGSGFWITTDQSEAPPTDSREMYGGSFAIAVWYDPDFEPEFPEETLPPSHTVDSLHIPHKEYAFNQSQVALTPKAEHFYFTNLKTIEAWASGLRCSGSEVVDTDEGEQLVTYTPTEGKWKERQLHIPHKEHFTSRHVRENYLAIERWANAICPPLHIPHKDWVLMGTAEQELVNLATIERWARDIGRCCEEILDDGNPEEET